MGHTFLPITPDFRGQALSLSQPSCGDLGVSLRRSSSQFNIRPWQPSLLGNPLLRLGLPRRSDSLSTRVAPAALAEKEAGVSPNGLGSGRRMGCECHDVGLARHCDVLGALDHAADRPAPARELAGGGDVGLVLVDPALQRPLAPLHEPSDALDCVPSRRGVRDLSFDEVLGVRRCVQGVPSRC